jgi:predicted DNA-binding transcriptional regulator YafY
MKISSVPQWSKEQAEQWSKEKYREAYLNLPNGFGHVEEAEKIAPILETELEKRIEDEIEDKPIFFPHDRSPAGPNNNRFELVQSAIDNSQYLGFKYGNSKTIAKPIALVDENKLLALCFVKNKELEFNLSQITNIQIKQDFYTTKLSGNIDVNQARDLIKMAMSYNKFLRMRYTRGQWINGDEITLAEQSLRTISGVGFATDYLENGVNPFGLNDDIQFNAFCNRDDMRKNFRFDRIDEVEVLDI